MTTPPDDHPSRPVIVPDCRCAECGICMHDHEGWKHAWRPRSGNVRVTTPPDDHPSLTTPQGDGLLGAALVELRLPVRRPPILVDTEAAAVHASRPVTVIYRWANEGRLTRHGTPGKGNARWDLREIPAWTGVGPRPAPPPVQAKNFQDRA